jgi:hypothetical protein
MFLVVAQANYLKEDVQKFTVIFLFSELEDNKSSKYKLPTAHLTKKGK